MNDEKKFTPLIFLASLGAGGIAVIPFAILQYMHYTGEGLVKLSDIDFTTFSLMSGTLFWLFVAVMIIFSIIHVVLSIIYFKKLTKFVKGASYCPFIKDPLKNSAILTPFISLVMTMNVFIGPARFFSPWMAENLQSLMLYAFLFWAGIFVFLLRMEIKLLKTSFEKGFDMTKITFGWLLHPFALAMLTVTGMGIAAMAQDAEIAHWAAFMSLVSGSMGIFLLIVKTIAIFQRHFEADGLGEKQFLPSFLIVIPNVTLYALSAFRFGHYLEHHHGFHLDAYFVIIIAFAFAFETWYMIFGLALLKDYFKKHYFKKEFYVTQWGFICPFVAYSVLGTFVYKVFYPSAILYSVVIISMLVACIFYFDLLWRQMQCAKVIKSDMQCEK